MGLKINIDWDSSVSSAPSGFETDVTAAVQYLENLFTNSVTLTIDVGYGEIDGQTLDSDALGESLANDYTGNFTYSQVRSALIAENAPGSSTLPATSPDSGSLVISTAEAKALGLSSYSGIDGWVGFSSTLPFSYGNGTTPPSNEYYFIGTVEHEITEDMGRTSLLNEQPHHYQPMDLYRYSSPGVRDLTTGGSGSTAYFSIDNGTTNLGTWNNQTSNGDLGDWYPSGPAPGGDDSFNDYSDPGVINVVSADDVTLMAALGWTTSSVTVSSVAALPGSGDLDAGNAVTITLAMTGAATVTGIPTLTLNDDGTATYDSSKSTSTSLAFDYTVGAGQNSAALGITSVNLPNGASITDSNGNNANLTLPAASTFTGLEIDTTPPSLTHDSTLSLNAEQTVAIPESSLQFDDNLSTHAQEIYTIVTAPQDGALLLSGSVSSSFTQANIDNGLISYRETVGGATSDSFTFTVTDAAGNSTAVEEFQFAITPVTTVSSGQTLVVSSGQTDSGVNIVGGTVMVQSGGTLSAATNLSGGVDEVFSGGFASGTMLNGAYEFIYNGGVASGTQIVGDQYVDPGGIARGATVSAGGAQLVYGTASGTTVSSGGNETVQSGGVTSNTTVLSGGVLELFGGATAIGLAISSGGKLEIGSGYTETISSGQTSTGLIVLPGGTDIVASGGVGIGTTLNAAYEFIYNGGVASGTQIVGDQYVDAGGVARNATVSGGGAQLTYGTASGTTDVSGGYDAVFSGGVANGTMLNGGYEYVYGGGVASGTQIVAGAQYVDPGGVANGATVGAGGAQLVYGTASSTTDVSGGYDAVQSGGVASGTMVNGGYEYIYGGGVASGTHILAGAQYDDPGGVAISATVGAGGVQLVYAAASNTLVASGGTGYVYSGGVVSGTTISGGTVNLESGGMVNGAITFAPSGGGILFDADQAVQADTVMGFSEGTDFLSFAGQTMASENAVVASAQLVNGNTVLTYPDHTSIVLVGVTHVDTGIFT